MKNRVVVTIEGPDNVGKDFLIRELKTYMKNNSDKRLTVIKEPLDELKPEINKALSDNDSNKVNNILKRSRLINMERYKDTEGILVYNRCHISNLLYQNRIVYEKHIKDSIPQLDLSFILYADDYDDFLKRDDNDGISNHYKDKLKLLNRFYKNTGTAVCPIASYFEDLGIDIDPKEITGEVHKLEVSDHHFEILIKFYAKYVYKMSSKLLDKQ